MSKKAKNDDSIVLIDRLPLNVQGQYMGLITLNRPDAMNPMNWDLIKRLISEFTDLSADKSVRVIAFTGAGKAFCAGGDLKSYLTLHRNEADFMQFLDDIDCLFRMLELAPQPVIALVNGFCVAGGIELMVSCNFAYAAESARIGDGHVKTGMIGGVGSQVRIPRRIRPALAAELIFTGKLLKAKEALEYGLVNRVVSDDKLLDAGLEFANTVAETSPLAIKKIKQLLYYSLNMREQDALYTERQVVHHYCHNSYDATEGLKAFAEKRKPKFDGR